MNKETITLHRHNAPDWVFKWDDKFCGLIHKTRYNIYQIFIGDPCDLKPIWIGRLSHDRKVWYTAEKGIGAKCVQLTGCNIFFN